MSPRASARQSAPTRTMSTQPRTHGWIPNSSTHSSHRLGSTTMRTSSLHPGLTDRHRLLQRGMCRSYLRVLRGREEGSVRWFGRWHRGPVSRWSGTATRLRALLRPTSITQPGPSYKMMYHVVVFTNSNLQAFSLLKHACACHHIAHLMFRETGWLGSHVCL